MNSKKIKIIDMGLGNINSISKCINFLNCDYEIIKDPSYLREDCKIIFPGVGNFNHAMIALKDNGWIETLKYRVLEKKNLFLGICLGMQLIGSKGSENNIQTDGLNFIDAEVVGLSKLGCKLKIPHTGWNSINILNENKIINDFNYLSDLYFNHSYAFVPKNRNIIISTTKHDIEFPSIINYSNIYGMQFHPEKSGNAGKILLRNFIYL